MKQIPGGVTAPKGFRAWGVHCGVGSEKANKEGLTLTLSDQECTATAVHTMNRVKATPLYVTMEHLEDGAAWGVATNSGSANACCLMSHECAEEIARLAARTTGRTSANLMVASTGVTGQALSIAAIRAGMPATAAGLTAGPEGSDTAARAIMTTNTMKKELALACSIDDRTVTFGAIAKDSGMIHPNMDTILCFVTTDCAVTREMLPEALREMVPRTFNQVAVDGDTSTNDIRAVLANGVTGGPLIEWKDGGYTVFLKALHQLCQELARVIAGDGGRVSRLVTCAVRKTYSEESAERLAKAAVGSPLVRAAMFGTDANWDRVLCVMGYSKAPFRPECVGVFFSSTVGAVAVCRDSMGLDFGEKAARSILSRSEVVIDVHLHGGEHEVTCWGRDLTYEYVKINGDYRA